MKPALTALAPYPAQFANPSATQAAPDGTKLGAADLASPWSGAVTPSDLQGGCLAQIRSFVRGLAGAGRVAGPAIASHGRSDRRREVYDRNQHHDGWERLSH